MSKSTFVLVMMSTWVAFASVSAWAFQDDSNFIVGQHEARQQKELALQQDKQDRVIASESQEKIKATEVKQEVLTPEQHLTK